MLFLNRPKIQPFFQQKNMTPKKYKNQTESLSLQEKTEK